MKLLLLLLIALTLSPAGMTRNLQSGTDDLRISPPEAIHAPRSAPAEGSKERLVVDVDHSIIQWKGTKFWGMGKHEGIVRLAEGIVIVRRNEIVAGRFVLDMTTIEVTDIPKSDPIPRQRLREHLMEEHFFFVERFPTAVFEISSARSNDSGRHRITGRLTMRGKTHGVSFDAHIPVLDRSALRATARFSINRHDWGVAYRGSRLTNDLVDDMIELNLVLVAHGPDES